MRSILFLCTGNSCRSQMAEGFARRLAGPDVRIFSAGTSPVGVHPRAVAAMAEVGIDIGEQRSKDVSEIPIDELDLVVTLCGSAAESCPALPGGTQRIHWPLEDPAKATGDAAQIERAFAETRDQIAERVAELLGG